MKTIRLNAFGKINLSLDVLERQSDGYHKLKMIMQEIDLKDLITIKEAQGSDGLITLTSTNSEIPTDHRNIAYRAGSLMAEKFNIDKNIEIHIEKNIPISAGLAGGSTDAAAVLKGLNELWDLKLSEEELMTLGLELGADVPFCIRGGTALSEGIGEKLTSLKPFKDKLILLANPGVSVSTGNVYKNLDLDKLDERPNIEEIISYIENDDMESLGRDMANVLETVTIGVYPQIQKIKVEMINCGALGSLMSGSGASVFGIFDDIEKLEACRDKLKKDLPTVIVTKTI